MMGNKRIHFILAIVAIWFCLFSHHGFALTPKEIYQKVSPGVVFIFAPEGQQMGRCGTGSIIREDGLVITNAHIFAGKGSSKPLSDISVYLKPEKVTGNPRNDLSRHYKGRIVAYDLPLDLALISITGVDVPLTTVGFEDSDRIVVGDQAYAIGHPEQGGLWSLTTGVISAQRQNFGGLIGKDLFQTEASINRGNSGGPLLDERGTMIGINSMIARTAQDGMAITDVNFSIKSNVALKWLKGLGHRFSPVGEIPPKPRKKVVQVPPQQEDKEFQRPEEPKSPQERGKVSEGFVKPEGKEKGGCEPDEKGKEQSPKGRILTEKNPYNMDELVAAMREMEELMDEMRGRIEEYRKRR
jgi:serine protease Do